LNDQEEKELKHMLVHSLLERLATSELS